MKLSSSQIFASDSIFVAYVLGQMQHEAAIPQLIEVGHIFAIKLHNIVQFVCLNMFILWHNFIKV